MLSSSPRRGTRLAPLRVQWLATGLRQREAQEMTMSAESLEFRMDRLERRVEILEKYPSA
jgi:hypothetical protein